MITLAAGGEYEGNAFGSVCVSVQTRNSKPVAPIDLIFCTRNIIYVHIVTKMYDCIYYVLLESSCFVYCGD